MKLTAQNLSSAQNKTRLDRRLTQNFSNVTHHSPLQIPKKIVLSPHEKVRIEAMEFASETIQVEHSAFVVYHPGIIHVLGDFCLLYHNVAEGFRSLCDGEGNTVTCCTLSPENFRLFLSSYPSAIPGLSSFMSNAFKLKNQLAGFDVNFPK
jgi:hypothetical protein